MVARGKQGKMDARLHFIARCLNQKITDSLPLEIITDDCKVLYLKTDLQITTVDAAEEGVFLEISLLSK